MELRMIPSSGEDIPVIGLGTYRGFAAEPKSAAYKALPGVLDALFEAEGRLIDSSPMYGRAERTTGELLAGRTAFLATKVWTTGREEGRRQIEDSFRLLKTDCIDLLQIHNLVDWKTHIATLQALDDSGRILYQGITHYSSSAHDEVESVLRMTHFDFLQINYALDDRSAEKRLLPYCQDRGIAVLVNLPFGGGSLLRRLADLPLPGWAPEVGATSWAQLALKFVLANPAVTCVIPGTGKRASMEANIAAGHGPMLTAAQVRELVGLVG